MFDLRYHVASLVAVFLALGLGILVGTIMVDEEALEKEQKRLIERLELDFHYLREQNALAHREIKEYKEALEVWERFGEAILPHTVEGQLDGRRVVLVQTGDKALPEGLVVNLEAAGAEIVTFINLKSIIEVDDLSVASLEGKNGEGPGSLASQVEQVVEQICYGADVNKEYHGNSNFLTDLSWQAPDTVILIGGTDARNSFLVEQLDLPLMANFQNHGFMVVGVEPKGMLYSYIPYYQKGADIIIDHIDTIPGQVALIWALTGFPGYYGTASEASALLPERY